MTINGSTSSSGWTYKLEVTETATSVQNRTSTVQIKAYLGRASSQSYLGGNYSVNVTCAGQTSTQSGNISYPTYINGGSWLLLKTFTFTVANTENPTTISISSTMSSGDFSPSSASASGTMQLTVLHLDPVINTATMVETNSVLTALNVPNTTIVSYLSKKTITLSATAYDNATLKYRLRHLSVDYALPSSTTFQNSATFNTDYTTHDVVISSDGKARLIQDVGDSMNGLTTDWLLVNVNGNTQYPNGIAYTKPTLEKTSTNIKRKSGNGTNLTDNKATLNLVGTIYKTNDVIGNNNSITQIGYKIWQDGASEPASYTSLTPTISGGNVTISDYEISNVDFTKIYNYKIILKDNYNYSDIIEGTIPLGQPTWTEYKDRVDFLNLTVKGYNPFEYSEDETICGVWNDGINEKTIYRKVVDIGYLPNNSTSTISHNISNLLRFTKIYGTATRSSDKDTLPIPYVTFASNNSGGITMYANDTSITIGTTTDRSSYYGYVVLEYIKS